MLLPEWLNDIHIVNDYHLFNHYFQGDENAWVIGNSLDNQITGNIGNNVIDGGNGFDTFVTQGNFDQSTGILNRDGSVS